MLLQCKTFFRVQIGFLSTQGLTSAFLAHLKMAWIAALRLTGGILASLSNKKSSGYQSAKHLPSRHLAGRRMRWIVDKRVALA